jgi:hypothetical protein
MSGLTASNLPLVFGVAAVTCTRNAGKRTLEEHRYRYAATAGWWTERNLTPPTIEAAETQGRDAKSKVAESAQVYIGKGALFQLYHPFSFLRG